MARDTHNTRFYTLSSFCKSAISLKGLGKLGLLINEAPRQVSDLLEPLPRCPGPLSALCRVGTVPGEREPIRVWNRLQIFEKTVLEAPASLALKVSARNVVGEAGSVCQKVRAGAEEAQSLGGLGGGSVMSHSGPPSLLLTPGIGNGC